MSVTLEHMPVETLRRAGVAALAAVALVTLSGCAGVASTSPLEAATPSAPSDGGTTGSEQSVAEGCSLGTERVTAILDEARVALDDAQSSVLAGELPDLSALVTTLEGGLTGLSHDVTNSEVAGALDDVRVAVAGFGDITAPDTLFGAPGYLSDLTGQLQQVQDAGKAFQQLCAAG